MSKGRYVDYRAEVRKQLADIDDVVNRANGQADPLDQAYLMQLAIIKLSGFVEHCVAHMLRGYLEENSSHRVLAFSKRQAERIGNLNPAKLEQLIAGFDSDWKTQLSAFLDTDENRQSLGNLIGARHKLAHGGQTKATPAILADYRRVAQDTVNLLFDMFLPVPSKTKL